MRFLHFVKPRLDLGLKSCIISSLDNQLHVLDVCLELRKVHSHGVAEVKRRERSSSCSTVYSDSLLLLAEENLAAGQACKLIDAVIDVSKPP